MSKFWKTFLIIISYIVAVCLGALFFWFINNIYNWWPQGGVFDFDTLGTYLAAFGSVGAIFIIWYTSNAQIKNQNKQINMPHLTVLGAGIIFDKNRDDSRAFRVLGSRQVKKYANTDDFKNAVYYDETNASELIEAMQMAGFKKDKNENPCFRKTNSFSIILKNIGYGVASNIEFYSINNSGFIAQVKFGSGEGFVTSEIAKEDKKEYYFDLDCFYIREDDNIDDNSVQLLILYSDLNDNAKKIYLTVSFDYEGELSHTFYQEGTHKYRKMMQRLSVNDKSIEKKYKNRAKKVVV